MTDLTTHTHTHTWYTVFDTHTHTRETQYLMHIHTHSHTHTHTYLKRSHFHISFISADVWNELRRLNSEGEFGLPVNSPPSVTLSPLQSPEWGGVKTTRFHGQNRWSITGKRCQPTGQVIQGRKTEHLYIADRLTWVEMCLDFRIGFLGVLKIKQIWSLNGYKQYKAISQKLFGKIILYGKRRSRPYPWHWWATISGKPVVSSVRSTVESPNNKRQTESCPSYLSCKQKGKSKTTEPNRCEKRTFLFIHIYNNKDMTCFFTVT